MFNLDLFHPCLQPQPAALAANPAIDFRCRVLSGDMRTPPGCSNSRWPGDSSALATRRCRGTRASRTALLAPPRTPVRARAESGVRRRAGREGEGREAIPGVRSDAKGARSHTKGPGRSPARARAAPALFTPSAVRAAPPPAAIGCPGGRPHQWGRPAVMDAPAAANSSERGPGPAPAAV